MIRKIFKTGHSAAVTLSKSLMRDLSLKVGDSVKLEVNSEKGEIIIRHGSKQNQMALDIKVRPHLGGKA